MRDLVWILALLLVLGLVGCGGDKPVPTLETEPSDVAESGAGEDLFHRVTQPPCTTCHSLEPGFVLAGPSLARIGAEAGSRVSGTTAAEYLRQSILEPSKHLAPGDWNNVMLETYPSQLTEQDVNNLVAYLMTLK
jgi:hypothetical protein